VKRIGKCLLLQNRVDAVVRPLLVMGTLLGTDKVKQDQHSATWLAHNKNMITLEMEVTVDLYWSTRLCSPSTQ